jgi:hypothetical protein
LLSERAEASVWGRRAILALVAVLLAAQLATHLPASPVREALRPSADRAVRLLGSEQAWGVFSPDPRRISIDIEARVTFADGTTATWAPPQGGPVITNLRYYRWRKWMERVRADDARGLWEPTARWVADEHRDGPSPPVRVDLVRHFRQNVAVGPQPPWQSFTYFTLDLDP